MTGDALSQICSFCATPIAATLRLHGLGGGLQEQWWKVTGFLREANWAGYVGSGFCGSGVGGTGFSNSENPAGCQEESFGLLL